MTKFKKSRDTIKDKLLGLFPKDYCKKCGRRSWVHGLETLSWSCAYCGNIIYLTYGAFKQQIEIVMMSFSGESFMYSVDKKKIIPKKDEELKALLYSQEKAKKRGKTKGKNK